MGKKCPSCGNKEIIIDTHEFAYCTGCELYDMVEKFPEQSVFDRITQSPEVLAEKLVVEYRHGVKDYAYYSTVTGGLYNTKAEAIAATVAKLKEVCND